MNDYSGDISVSQKATCTVLDAFAYGNSLTQSEIARLTGMSEMTVSRAVRKLKQSGVLDLREEVDRKGAHKRRAVYPRDMASLLVLDFSTVSMRAVLFDTSLTTVREVEHTYNSAFDYEDNLRRLLNLAEAEGVISEWRGRKILPALPFSKHRKEIMRRSRAKRIAGLVAKMKLCSPPLLRLGIIMPNEHTRRAIGASIISDDSILRIICDILDFEAAVCLEARNAVIQGAPSVTARFVAVRTNLADARSILFFGCGSPFGCSNFALYLCRSRARAAWRLPDGASDLSCFTSIGDLPTENYIQTLSDFIKPDILAIDKTLASTAPQNALLTDTRLTAAIGAAILLRRSAWEEYIMQ